MDGFLVLRNALMATSTGYRNIPKPCTYRSCEHGMPLASVGTRLARIIARFVGRRLLVQQSRVQLRCPNCCEYRSQPARLAVAQAVERRHRKSYGCVGGARRFRTVQNDRQNARRAARLDHRVMGKQRVIARMRLVWRRMAGRTSLYKDNLSCLHVRSSSLGEGA